MADHNKQQTLSRRATSQGPQAYSSSQTVIPHQRVTEQALRTRSSSQITAESTRIKSLFDFLILCHKGEKVEPWTIFDLTSKEKERLWSILESQGSLYDYVTEKLRFDWSPNTSRFIVRMPKATHELFITSVVDEIFLQLTNSAREDEEVRVILKSLNKRASTDIELEGFEQINDEDFTQSPDASIGYADAPYASIVIEVANSQPFKDLPMLAYNYVQGSDGDINIILGFDLVYGDKSQEATVSIWRPREEPDPENVGDTILKVMTVQEAEPFRADDGTIIKGLGFSLQLRDFAPQPIFAKVSQDAQNKTVVQVTREQLFAFLCNAETLQKAFKEKTGPRTSRSRKGNRKRELLEATSPEHFSPEKGVQV